MANALVRLGSLLPAGFILLAFFAVPTARATETQPPMIKLYEDVRLDSRLGEPLTKAAFDEGFTGGVRTALGDVNGDGEIEVIVAAGPGGGPQVQIFTKDGTRIGSFFVYDRDFRKGIHLAAGDVDGDGTDEVITGASSLDGAEVKVFTASGTLLENFYPYDAVFRGDVLVAAGDVDGDGTDEVITGSGPGGGPHVRVFDGDGTWLGLDYFPYADWDRGGVAVAAADVTGDGRAEVITSIFSAGPAIVKVYGYRVDRPIYATFDAFPNSFRGGASVAAADLDGDGRAEIVAGAGYGGGPQIRTFTGLGTPTPAWTFAYALDFRGGVYVASARDSGAGNVLAGPKASRAPQEKRILVDISEQRLYAYEGEHLVRTFLISSGLPNGFETPRGEFSVIEKIPVKHYKGYYGPGSPLNFDLPNTKWNLRFTGPYLLHGAYWHNDFGKKKSHGCVNIHYTNAEWLYNWAPLGTPVIVID